MITYWIFNPIQSAMLFLGFIIGVVCGYKGKDQITELYKKVKSVFNNKSTGAR